MSANETSGNMVNLQANPTVVNPDLIGNNRVVNPSDVRPESQTVRLPQSPSVTRKMPAGDATVISPDA